MSVHFRKLTDEEAITVESELNENIIDCSMFVGVGEIKDGTIDEGILTKYKAIVNDNIVVGIIRTYEDSVLTFATGIYIFKDSRKKGYAEKALKHLISIKIHNGNYFRARHYIYSNNVSSIKLHEKIGFKFETSLSKCAIHDGKYVDFLTYVYDIEDKVGS